MTDSLDAPDIDNMAMDPTDYCPQEPPSKTARRYRSSSYFLEDQLKRSDALNEFRLTKTIVNNLPQFSLQHQLEFAVQYANLNAEL